MLSRLLHFTRLGCSILSPKLPGITLSTALIGIAVKDLMAKLQLWGVFTEELVNFVLLIEAILLSFMSLLALASNASRVRFVKPRASKWFFFSYWLWAALGALSEPQQSAGLLLTVLIGCAFFLISMDTAEMLEISSRFLRGYLLSSVIITLGVAVLGGDVLLVVGGFWTWEGLASHANLLGFGMALAILLELSQRTPRAAGIWVGAYAIALLASGSLGSMLALVAGLTILGIQRYRLDLRRGKAFFVAAIAMLSAVLVLIFSNRRLESATALLSGRDKIWSAVFESSGDSTFFGLGLDFLGQLAPGSNAHNDVLHAFAVSGPLGVLLLSVALILKVVELVDQPMPGEDVLPAIFVFTATVGLVEIPLYPSFSLFVVAALLLFSPSAPKWSPR